MDFSKTTLKIEEKSQKEKREEKKRWKKNYGSLFFHIFWRVEGSYLKSDFGDILKSINSYDWRQNWRQN